MTTCPECNGEPKVIDTRRNAAGKRRRWECLRCGYRWTLIAADFDGSPVVNRRMSDEVLRDILTSPASNAVISSRYGLSPKTASMIRNGKLHADRLPELPRRMPEVKQSCLQCVNYRPTWSPPCGFGFPDCLELGSRAAQSCLQFRTA